MKNKVNKARITEVKRESIKRKEEKYKKLTVEEEIKIARMIEEKQEK